MKKTKKISNSKHSITVIGSEMDPWSTSGQPVPKGGNFGTSIWVIWETIFSCHPQVEPENEDACAVSLP